VLGLVAAVSPFLLGSLADRYGLATAFALEPALIAGCLVLLWGGLRARHRAAAGAAPAAPDPSADRVDNGAAADLPQRSPRTVVDVP
jgi:MFS family permease